MHTSTRLGHPLLWTAALFVTIVGIAATCIGVFAGKFSSYIPVIVTSPRAGLVMEPGAKVKLRGVEVGRVATVASHSAAGAVSITLNIDPGQARYIPANVGAEIRATTLFGAKYVDLIYPTDPSAQRISAGTVLPSRNVSTEVNTVFENLTELLRHIDVAKLNATLTALAEGMRGQGDRIGHAITDANDVLSAINPRMDLIGSDWRSFGKATAAYSGAAQDLVAVLDAASTTSVSITSHEHDLDTLLINTIGFGHAGTDLLAPNLDNAVTAINALSPTADLLMKYNPEYTCLLVGAKYALDHGGYDAFGGNGHSLVADSALLLGDDPYQYPDNLPIVAAKGGPGGKPSCGSLPDVAKNFPVRSLVTNTGWGTGVDIRPNPGIGHPCWADWLPVTRAAGGPPSIRQCLPGPAPGPILYPGAPPYGAPMYGPGGTPLYPGVAPPAPPVEPVSPPVPDPVPAP
ncbi:MCE family protein [Mycolicibacterium sp. CH28]|uniref:MCE family protein n=1 Tax=Mycolicibacterium sp. CH28 TaxID=2512237 RepID=UPI001081C4F1|nr:MCE family protein [Mycolicibacterium sp. CH28]TGD87920.1 MCE family protein [Mycolicibacterium sp. CH28]